jgi:hypothetical protein
MASDPSLDDRIDALYAGPAEEFIAARDALVKELRAAKEKDGAATVKALRKPTVAAWAVNRVAHTHRDDVRELIDVGDALRAAHDALLEGQGDGAVREATGRRRSMVADLTDRAVAELANTSGGSAAAAEGQRDAISHTFDAAVADPEAAAAVLAGRLVKELQAPSGFGGGLVFGDVAAAPRAARSKPTTRRRPATDEGDDEAERARQQEEQRRRDEHLEQLRSELAERQREADEATRLADESHDEVERLQAEVEAAEVRARDADTAARRARKAVEQAQRELERASS